MTCKHASSGCNYPESECLGTCHAIKDARARANLTQLQASRVCYVSLRTWIRWEHGDSRMPQSAWELFTLRTDPTAELEASI